MPVPETRYTKTADGVHIAYQVIGEGPIDLVWVMGWTTNLEALWEEPHFADFLRRVAGFSRLILFDKRGMGLSDRVALAAMSAARRSAAVSATSAPLAPPRPGTSLPEE